MYKLLIVDDEPLVQAGIKSMLNWADLNIEVTGTAFNGQAALKMILQADYGGTDRQLAQFLQTAVVSAF